MIRYVEADGRSLFPSRVLAQAMPREAINHGRFLRQVVLDPNFRPAGSILAFDDETPVGYALSVARHVPVEGVIPDPDRGYLWLMGVVPEARGKGIGSELLERVEGYLRSEGKRDCLVSAYSPGYFIPGVDVEAYPEGLRFLTARGYREVGRPIAMETSLWDLEIPHWVNEIEEKRKAEGVRISRAPFLDAHRLLEFARAEFGPDWARYARESMLRQMNGDSRTGLSIATQGHGDDERIVGFAHFDGERFGPIGVAPSERGRGLGQLLLFDVLARQREAGHRVSWFLWSDDRTADRLYKHAGFRVVRRFALLKKELS